MKVQNLLENNKYTKITEFKHDDIILSDIYVLDTSLVVVDRDTIFNTEFSYKLFCQKQNEWMKTYSTVYRFVEDDMKMAHLYLYDEDLDYIKVKGINRALHTIDPTPLESIFETCFEKAFDRYALNYLSREYSFQMSNGKIGYIDYALFNKNRSWIAIEENGISYHHPYLIKSDKYKIILNKQNAVTPRC